MQVYFVPSRRECLRRRNHFDDFFMDTLLSPSSFMFDEDKDFDFMKHPLRRIRRISPYIIPRGIKNINIRTEKENNEEKENKKCKKDSNKNTESSKYSSQNEEKSLTKKDNFLNQFINFEEIFPSFNELSTLLRNSEEGPFEVNVNLRGCDPEKVKVEIKDDVLKVEGSKKTSEGSYTYVRHEQTIPKGVSASSLKASLLPEGILTIRQDQKQDVPVTMITEKESEKSSEESRKNA
ncbi:UNVERIFIED_CONTAM: hypothetical protein RMT77_000536 [Armadillidium vulgare]